MTTKNSRLGQALAGGGFVIAPGVYDMITARLADRLGFDAIYMTGYGTVASHLGLPDAGLASYTDMVGRVRQIAGGTETPLIADADTGYGGLLNVAHTVQGYEAAGASAIQLEDQEMPKKCGHTPGRRVIPIEDMVAKVKVAVASRASADTLIIARTDSRTTLGLDEALRRGEAYARAGADIVFIESPESVDELEAIGRRLAGSAKLLANMVQGGRTPEVPADQLQAFGFSIAIYPGLAMRAAAAAVDQTYRHLQSARTATGAPAPLYDTMHELMGFPEVWAFEERWQRDEAAE